LAGAAPGVDEVPGVGARGPVVLRAEVALYALGGPGLGRAALLLARAALAELLVGLLAGARSVQRAAQIGLAFAALGGGNTLFGGVSLVLGGFSSLITGRAGSGRLFGCGSGATSEHILQGSRSPLHGDRLPERVGLVVSARREQPMYGPRRGRPRR